MDTQTNSRGIKMSYVTTEIIYDRNGKVLKHEGYWYPDHLPVALCKGDRSRKRAKLRRIPLMPA